MGLSCPKCRGNMKISSQIDLPPDNRSDEISIQTLKCNKCKFEFLGVYEESRRGQLGSESFNHMGYRAPQTILKELKEKISKCPNPRNTKCKCRTHEQFIKENNSGAQSWIQVLNEYESFPIIFNPHIK